MSIDVSTLAVEVRSTGINDTAQGLQKIFVEAGKAERRVKTLTDTVLRMDKAFIQGTASAQAYQAAVAQANRQVGGHNAATAALTQAMNGLSGSMSALNANLGRVNTGTVRNTRSIRVHTEAMRDAHAMARGLAGSMGALWVTYGKAVPLALGVGIGASFMGIIKVGKDVEHTLESIRIKGQETMEAVAGMRDAIQNIGQGVYGPQEVAKAFETLILAGLNAKQAMVGIKDALNLAIVGDTTIEKASYTLVQVATSLGYTAEGFGRVSDVIAKTAAVSMSSVESLSEAFKSASAVGKLYGATLVDIGTGLAALSQLGIQGSAAGTSLKNFYKELATETDKLKNVMAALKMKPADLKDANGQFLDMVTVVGRLSDGLNRLQPAQQKIAMGIMSNERGVKTLVEVLDMYRKKTEDGTSALQKFRDQIADSYAFTAIGAAQMALTVENQFKTVKNTLQDTFREAFLAIQPELLVFSTRLKEIFRSDEFKRGLQTIATTLAELAIIVANNIDKIVAFVAAFMTFKTVMFVVGALQSMAAGFAALRAAMIASRISLLAFQASLGLIGVVLIAAGAAWAYYHSQKDTSPAKEASALTNLQEYNKSLSEEADRMGKVNAQLALGKGMKEADVQVTQDQAMAQAEKNKQLMVEAAIMKRNAALDAYANAKVLRPWLADGGDAGVAAKSQLAVAEDALNKAQAQGDALIKSIRNNIERVRGEAKVTAAYQEKKVAEDQARARAGAGTGVIEKSSNSAAKAAEREIFSLVKITAAYKARGDALAASATTQVAVMAGVHEAQVQAEIDEGKLAGSFATRALAAAKAADEMKFYKDGQVALHETSAKITTSYAVEKAAMEEAASGRSKLTGVMEAQTEELLRQWKLDANGETAKRMLAQARATDEMAASKERLLKFNRATETIGTEARSTIEAADAMQKYGLAGRQTALELAQLKIAQDSIDPETQAAKNRLNAAALMDIATALKVLTKTGLELAKDNEQLEAEQVDAILNSESEKTLAKHNTAMKAIEFSVQQAEAAKLALEVEGKFVGEAVTAYEKLIAAKAQAAGNLNTNTSLKLGEDRKSELTTLIEESKTLGSTLATVFGDAGTAIGGMVTGMGQLVQAQESYVTAMEAAAKLRAKGDGVKALKVEETATKNMARAQMKSYADMAGSAKMFFKEGSTGYKILHAAEKAFRIAEMAMAYEAMIRKIFFTQAVTGVKVGALATETAAEVASVGPTVAAEGAKASASGIAAFAKTLASLPFPFNIAAGAAVLALLVGAGVSMMGGGGSGSGVPVEATAAYRQEHQGTGTVLGDSSAKSESIVNALELLAANSDIALTHTANMLTALRSIRDGIAGMAQFVSRSSGLRGTTADEFALGVGESKSALGFGSRSTELVDSGIQFDRLGTRDQTVADVMGGSIQARGYADLHKQKSSWWGLSKSSSNETVMSELDQGLKDQMVMTIGSLYEGVIEAAAVFGKDRASLEVMLNGLSLDALGLEKISLKGLTGKEVEEELLAVFGAAGDRMAETVMPGLKEFQKVGEGYFETLIRVANGTDVAGYALERLNITAIAYTDITNKQGDVAAEIVRESILAVEALSGTLSGIGEIVATLDGNAENLVDIYRDLAEARDLMNANGLNGDSLSRDTIRGAGGLDALTSGVKTFLSDFFTEAEQQATRVTMLTKEFAALGIALPATKEAFRALVLAADDGTAAGDSLVGKLLALASAFGEAAEGAVNLQQSLAEDAFAALERAVDRERDRLTDAYNAEVKRIKQETEDALALQKTRLAPAQEALKAIQTVFDAIKAAIKSTVVESYALNMARRREAQSTLASALAFAQGGGSLVGFQGMDAALANIQKPSEDFFATFEDYARDQAQTANLLGGLAAAGKAEVDKAQLTIDAINGTIEAIKKASDKQLATLELAHTEDMDRLDAIIERAQAQMDALNGIDQSVISVEAAIVAFQAAWEASMGAKGIPIPPGMGGGSGSGITSGVPGTQIGPAGSFTPGFGADGSYATADGSTFASATRVQEIMNESQRIADMGSIFMQYLGRTPDIAAMAFYEGASQADILAAVKGSAEYAQIQASGAMNPYQGLFDSGILPSFDVGTNWTPEDMTANIHEGERIIPKADNIELMNRLKAPAQSDGKAELAAAIEALNSSIRSGDVANVQATKEFVKVVKRWDTDGMPTERVVT